MELSMNDRSSTCNQVICASTPSAISSQESVDGASHFNSLVGLQTDLYGQAHAHASHSHQRETTLQNEMNDTYGPPSSISSASAALTLSLGSRLQQQLAKVGLMEYKQTWSLKTTPAGRQYWAHTASQPRTSGSDSIGLGDQAGVPLAGQQTAMTMEDAQSVDSITSMDAIVQGRQKIGLSTMNTMETSLVAGWCSPSARDWKDTPGMATTATNPDGSKRTRIDQLPRQACLGIPTKNCHVLTGKGVGLNVEHSQWLMGFPVEWTCSGVTAMQSFRRSRKHS